MIDQHDFSNKSNLLRFFPWRAGWRNEANLTYYLGWEVNGKIIISVKMARIMKISVKNKCYTSAAQFMIKRQKNLERGITALKMNVQNYENYREMRRKLRYWIRGENLPKCAKLVKHWNNYKEEPAWKVSDFKIAKFYCFVRFVIISPNSC